MDEAQKTLDEIKALVRDEIIEEFVEEMLGNLDRQPAENAEWAAGVKEWIHDEIY